MTDRIGIDLGGTKIEGVVMSPRGELLRRERVATPPAYHDIVRAVAACEPYQTLPFVRPGGDILLKLGGWPTVERVLILIDAVEALGIDPADAAPDYWRHVHNRLTAGDTPRAYTREQHRAWLLRRRAEP